MPVKVRDHQRFAILLLIVSCLVSTQTSTYAQTNAASDSPAKSDESTTQPAEPKTLAAAEPDDPHEAYLLNQRRSVQALRRLNNSLLTEEVRKKFKSNEREYSRLLTQGPRRGNAQDLEAIRSGIAYRVYTLTEPVVQQNALALENALAAITREMKRAGSSINNNQQRQAFRKLYFAEIMRLLPALYENNLIARSVAFEVLQGMEVVPPNQGRVEMYDDVAPQYIRVLKDPKQPEAVKARVANSMTNYLQKVDAIPQIQMAFAAAIAKELENPYGQVAYHEYLLYTLEEISTSRQIVSPGEAIHFSIAAKLMQDIKRDIRIRCHATAVFGRGGFDNRTNFNVLAWATAQLTVQTAFLFNAGNKDDKKWVASAGHLFRAFHHWTSQEVGEKKGFLNRDQKNPNVRAAADNALPVIVHMMTENANVPPGQIIKLLKWTEANKPGNMKFDPASDPLQPIAGNAGGGAAVPNGG